MQGVVVLGSTGSIGRKTLEVMSWYPECYHLVAIVANQNIEQVVAQCKQYQPRYVVLGEQAVLPALKARLKAAKLEHIMVLSGEEGIQTVLASHSVQIVVAAIAGSAGLLPTLFSVQAGKKVLLANKESLVMAGALFMQAIRESGAEVIPIDSEHHAIFQCLQSYRIGDANPPEGIDQMVLTASGGPFRGWALEKLIHATPEQACAHPIWSMGPKISVDSATLMNKGLEVIEAHYLFNMPAEKIEVLIHPQSIVHSLLTYKDGSVLAQFARPDMAIPILSALHWPRRACAPLPRLDLAEVSRLSFEKVDVERFPCLQLAYDALRAGPGAGVVLNAANEIAVGHFLKGKLSITDIPKLIASVLEKIQATDLDTLEKIIWLDEWARDQALLTLKGWSRASVLRNKVSHTHVS